MKQQYVDPQRIKVKTRGLVMAAVPFVSEDPWRSLPYQETCQATRMPTIALQNGQDTNYST